MTRTRSRLRGISHTLAIILCNTDKILQKKLSIAVYRKDVIIVSNRTFFLAPSNIIFYVTVIFRVEIVPLITVKFVTEKRRRRNIAIIVSILCRVLNAISGRIKA